MGGHEPVLVQEVLDVLAVRPGGLYADGTLGLGGHARAVLEASAPDGRLLGVDRDGETLEEARAVLAPWASRTRLVHAEYADLPRVLGAEKADGVLLDLGVSSLQLDRPERGFSFRSDGPLDMRMDRSGGQTAADIVNRTSEAELADIIFRFGEERASRRIARGIVSARRAQRIATTGDLARVVRAAIGGRPRTGIDPATRTFQALRIHVNRELERLGDVLSSIARTLAPAGRMAVISFHSLEDREVKHAFAGLARDEGFALVTRKPIRPSDAETARNPRARSARLRGLSRQAA